MVYETEREPSLDGGAGAIFGVAVLQLLPQKTIGECLVVEKDITVYIEDGKVILGQCETFNCRITVTLMNSVQYGSNSNKEKRIMRIDRNTAAYHSIIWFACDVAGRMIVANSSEGEIPEFVAEDMARSEWLASKLCGIKAVDRDRTPPIDYQALASKGFYCFVNEDPYDGSIYHAWAKPQEPLLVNALDEEIQQLLLRHKLEVDALKDEYFHINRE